MLLQNHFKGRVKLWNVKIGYSYSEHIEMNDRVSHKSSCSPRERSEPGSPIPLHSQSLVFCKNHDHWISSQVGDRFPCWQSMNSHTWISMEIIAILVQLEKKKKSFKQANQVLLRTEQRTFFFFLRSNKKNHQTSVHFRENYIQEQVKPLKYIL